MNSKKYGTHKNFGLRSLLFGMLVFMAACKNDAVPDVANVQVELHSRRFDRDLYAVDTNNIPEGLRALQAKYPHFFSFYADTLMALNIGTDFSNTNPGIVQGMHSFLTYPDYRNLFDTIQKHYPDTKAIDDNLKRGFQYLKHYYPQTQVPEIIYFNSFLGNWGVVVTKQAVAVGLDMFLGAHYPFYASVGQPEYMYINFRPESIAPSVFSLLYLDYHPFKDEDENLLEMMLQKGKQQYFLEKVLPFVAAEDRIGYTPAQLKWCAENEALIYNFFLNNNFIFEKNWSKIRRYVEFGPGTAGMPPEAPGNIGTWLGMRMVQAYAAEHPKASLEEIFSFENAERFLKEAKYKPK